MSEGTLEKEKEDEVEYSPDPDVRLVRNIWTKGDVGCWGAGQECQSYVGNICLQ
jgi:hypothetical protein